jgi:mRNA interferase MazF
VLVSRNEAYVVRESVSVIEVTTRVRGIRSEVRLGKREGLGQSSVANADNIQTIRKRRLLTRAGVLPPDKLRELDRALAYSLALPCAAGG